jgi:chromosome transmission fidelity protein 8
MAPLTSCVVRCPAGLERGGAGQWVVVELQGALQLELPDKAQAEERERKLGLVGEAGVATAPTMAGLDLGLLSSEGGVPVLEIGCHRLEGKVVSLKRPLAVLELRRAPASAPGEGEGEGGAAPEHSDEGEFEVVGIVRSKLLFKSRPKPLVGKRARTWAS